MVRLRLRAILATLCLFGLLALVGAAGVGATGATTVTWHWTFPVNGVSTNPCTGHPLQFVGSFEYVTHVTFNSNGGNWVTNGHLNSVGTDLVTGQRLLERGHDNRVKWEEPGVTQPPWNVTHTYTQSWIGPGPGNNLVSHTTAHVTFSANGVQTAFHDKISIECR